MILGIMIHGIWAVLTTAHGTGAAVCMTHGIHGMIRGTALLTGATAIVDGMVAIMATTAHTATHGTDHTMAIVIMADTLTTDVADT